MDTGDVDPKYTSMCSERTLQEEDKGFFNQLVQTFLDNTQAAEWAQEMWVKQVYGTDYVIEMTTENSIFNKLLEIVSVQPVFRKKNAETAAKVRKIAGKELKSGNLQKALTFCNQAVIMSPTPGLEENLGDDTNLAMSLWLRAECLMRMSNYRLALRDLQATFRTNLPSKYKGMLFHRQGECYQALNELSRAKISYELALRLLPKESNMHGKLKIMISELGCSECDETGKQRNDRTHFSNAPVPKGNTDKPASKPSAVDVDHKPGMGRFAIAKNDLTVGETIIEEEPYAACLKQTSFGTHCNNCFVRLQAPYGCQKCANLAFCSPECRETALETYHKYECSFMDLFVGSGMSILCNLALRMVTQNGLEKALAIYRKHIIPREKQRLCDGENNGIDLNDRENVIYNLCTHTEMRSSEDYLKRAVMAFFLLRCLQKSSFFCENTSVYDMPTKSNALSKEELSVFVLLLYHIQMLQFNAHEIEEIQKSELQNANSTKTKAIGVGIFPTVSLFNHDCHQEIGRYFVGKKIVMKALKPIAQGEMLPENYGPVFTRRTKYARQRTLYSRYWFKCQCLACVEIWPTLEQMADDKHLIIKCQNKDCNSKLIFDLQSLDVHCPSCNCDISNEWVNDIIDRINLICSNAYEEGEKLMKEHKYKEAIPILSTAISNFYEIAYPPHRKTHIAEQNLKLCHNIIDHVQ